jgi:hypothetical protein
VSRQTVVIAGALAQRPGRGGHTWQFLQYALGYRALGWDVLFLDRLEPNMCVDRHGRPCPVESSFNLHYFLQVMKAFGLEGHFSLLLDGGSRTVGLSRSELLERVRGAAFLLNVMGYLDDREILDSAPRRVFLDTDPGYGQMWRSLGLADVFTGHDVFVTVGENMGQAGCRIPPCGLHWITSPQPVVLREWPAFRPSGGFFTAVASWRGPYGPIDFEGTTYGVRVHEFRKFMELPRSTGRPFQLALDIDPSDSGDRRALDRNGWLLANPMETVGDPWTYRRFIQQSKAEFMVAKSMYVQTNSGWVSERSMCYLASGKPVLAQETGLSDRYPTGEGLLTFTTFEEARLGVEEISRSYRRHSAAARALAEEFFHSDKVLTRLAEQVCSAPVPAPGGVPA